jgi:hypothetical protein
MTKEILKNYMKYHEVQFIETNENFIVSPNTSLQQEYLEQWSRKFHTQHEMSYLEFDKETGKNLFGTRSYILIIDKLQF